MPTEYEVTCINKSDRQNVHEKILSIGGVVSNQRWKLSQQEAIKEIEKGTRAFYVSGNRGSKVKIVVAISAYGHQYLKTEADNTNVNNLLSLPECP